MMKRCLGLTLAGMLLSAAGLNALPDRVAAFGTVVFSPNTERFEDFATDRKTWRDDRLEGEWTPFFEDDDAAGELYQLQLKALVVLGVPSENVTVLKDSGELSRFDVVYAPGPHTAPDADKLLGRLMRNVEAYTGEKSKASAGAAIFRMGAVEIAVTKRGEDKVLVAFRETPDAG